jgi:hypothetical protein
MSEKTVKQVIAAFNMGVIQDAVTMYLLLKRNGYTMEDVVNYMDEVKLAYMKRMAIGNKELRKKLKENNPTAYKAVVEERKRQWRESPTKALQPDGSWKPCCKDKAVRVPTPPPPPIPQNTINEVK